MIDHVTQLLDSTCDSNDPYLDRNLWTISPLTPPDDRSQLIDCNYIIVANGSANILGVQLSSIV
jgi:hypothetical protein